MEKPLVINPDLTRWYLQSLTGSMDTAMDWRCIHDQRKDLPAHNFRGTFAEQFETLKTYNENGYGIFCLINATDGKARELSNVIAIRAHVVDMDNTFTSAANYERAVINGASFAVQSSPGKYHVYWKMFEYSGNEFYTAMQRKLAQLYDGDTSIIDSTRVMRVPGFLHRKGEPYMVTGWPLAAAARVRTWQEMEAELAHVNVIAGAANRCPLGTPELAAPSFEWLKFALTLVDPNEMPRAEWLLFSAAVKQAGWNHADDNALFTMWSEWCARYKGDEPGENRKLWNSIRDTEVGWNSIKKRCNVEAYISFGFQQPPAPGSPAVGVTTPSGPDAALAAVQRDPEQFGEILSEEECKIWFKDCYFVERTGEIFIKSGRFMNSTQFNGRYGGKQFIISTTGKLTDEPWKAALRSTVWTIPRVDHVRFAPDQPMFSMVEDALGRVGINSYIPAKIDARPGDVSIWLDHVTRILPVETDRKIFFDYMAHCVKYPGFKIQWAPLLQSAEGIGKTVFDEVMRHALGDPYVYSPNAQKLVESGSTFNAWQRGKLLIVVNEIKIDERRELIEILKPWITDKRIEIQSKGVDQDMEDNAANWLLFSNYKDAIPISQNGRRYCIFYSVLQSHADIINAGMNEEYFNRLWKWLRDEGGVQAVAHWLLNYPIEKGQIPVRAPQTSSYTEALAVSRSPMEVVVAECIADGITGFRGGYVSTLAVINRVKAAGIRMPNTRTVQNCLEHMGYVRLGRALRAYFQEDPNNRAEIYGIMSSLPLEMYGRSQGYE